MGRIRFFPPFVERPCPLFQTHWPYRREDREGRFSANKAIDAVFRRRKDLQLNRSALDTLKKARSFYHGLSHATMFSMNDIMSIGGSGEIFLGASFDEAKLPFYRQEVAARVSLARTLSNVIDGVGVNMIDWPIFRTSKPAS